MNTLRNSLAALALVTASLLSGCGSYLSYTELNTAPAGHAPRSAQAVEVFASAPPTRPHVDVRVIEGQQGVGEGTSDVVEELRAEAGRQGCDAIYLRGVQIATVKAGAHASATCVMYTDGGAPPPAPVAPVPANTSPVAGAVLRAP